MASTYNIQNITQNRYVLLMRAITGINSTVWNLVVLIDHWQENMQIMNRTFFPLYNETGRLINKRAFLLADMYRQSIIII